MNREHGHGEARETLDCFSHGVGDLCSITEDVWVSPSGNDDNLGTSEAEAFLTIDRAFEMIAPSDNSPVTINLTAGTFYFSVMSSYKYCIFHST